MTKVAIEQGLTPFQKALETAGYVVVQFQGAKDLSELQAHAIVISGADDDFTGVQSALESSVITASGRTPEEVVDEVRRSLGPRE